MQVPEKDEGEEEEDRGERRSEGSGDQEEENGDKEKRQEEEEEEEEERKRRKKQDRMKVKEEKRKRKGRRREIMIKVVMRGMIYFLCFFFSRSDKARNESELHFVQIVFLLFCESRHLPSFPFNLCTCLDRHFCRTGQCRHVALPLSSRNSLWCVLCSVTQTFLNGLVFISGIMLGYVVSGVLSTSTNLGYRVAFLIQVCPYSACLASQKEQTEVAWQ